MRGGHGVRVGTPPGEASLDPATIPCMITRTQNTCPLPSRTRTLASTITERDKTKTKPHAGLSQTLRQRQTRQPELKQPKPQHAPFKSSHRNSNNPPTNFLMSPPQESTRGPFRQPQRARDASDALPLSYHRRNHRRIHLASSRGGRANPDKQQSKPSSSSHGFYQDKKRDKKTKGGCSADDSSMT